MSVGFSILAHGNLRRCVQLAATLAGAGPVVLHIDAAVAQADFDWLRARLSRYENVLFAPRVLGQWGTFSLVQAQLSAAETLLARYPDLVHVCQLSGDSLPTRPLGEFTAFLGANPDTDFIESVKAGTAHWIKGGLEHERFTLYFPFNWKRQRRLFDLGVALQRRLRVKRALPLGLEAYIGAQWWVLTARTLRAILDDPRRAEYARYFRRSWIPDESYFQSLARLHARKVESRALCFARFDHAGRPVMFYDDHVAGLENLDTYFARKIWPGADALYNRLLDMARPVLPRQPGLRDRFLRHLAQTEQRRLDGRRGLMMQARAIGPSGRHIHATAVPYVVLQGFGPVFGDIGGWLHDQTGAQPMGRIFHPDGARFWQNAPVGPGGQTALAVVRDYRPHDFLRNLIWAQRETRPVFAFEPGDSTIIARVIERDPNARVLHIRSAWILDLLRQPNADPVVLRDQAATALAREKEHMANLLRDSSPARVLILPLGQVLANPTAILDPLVRLVAPTHSATPLPLPQISWPHGLADFITALKNAGVNLTYHDDGLDLRRDADQQRARLLS